MRHILLTWNPGPDDDEQWTPEEWEATMVKETDAGRTIESGWSVANRKNNIEAGDRGYLYRQGSHGRGLVAIGEIQSEPEPGERFDDPDRITNYVDVEWIECLPLDDRVTVEQLASAIPTFPWDKVFSSGREVKGADGAKLEEFWTLRTTDDDESSVGEGAGIGEGAGFGDSETNRLVELAAMDVVMSAYESDGFDVEDVSAANCGWDVTARKNPQEIHVEVKGAAGPAVRFLLTANEYKTAKVDPQWILAVVTKALTDPQRYELDPANMFDHALPFMYQVRVPDHIFA